MARYVAVSKYSPAEHRVALFYWRPGREFKDESKLPKEFLGLMADAKWLGSNYLVYACTDLPGRGVVGAYALCMGIDQPRKKYGRDKALGRLRSKLLHLNYDLVVVPTKAKDESFKDAFPKVAEWMEKRGYTLVRKEELDGS